MAEQNILAYFKTPEEAEAAKHKLQMLRVEDISIDRISRFGGDGNDRIMNPVTGDFDGLGELTLGADFSSRSASILAAADPGASGMSDGGQDEVTGRDILLTAVVDEAVQQQALQVVQSGGGLV